jgi:uncharacterized membrane protein
MSEPPPGGEPGRSGARGWSDERVEQVVGNLLRVGVVLSALVVLAGGVCYLYQEGSAPASEHHVFKGEPAQTRRILGIIRDAWGLHPLGLIEFGLLLLIATPVARVVFSVVAFIAQHDRTYVMITLLVLAILLYSLFSGHIH